MNRFRTLLSEAGVAALFPEPVDRTAVTARRRAFRLSVEDIAALGVRRISVGGALALAGWTGFIRAARALRSQGTFTAFADLVPYAEIDALFAADRSRNVPMGDACGRSESLDPDDVGDIADEGAGHRG